MARTLAAAALAPDLPDHRRRAEHRDRGTGSAERGVAPEPASAGRPADCARSTSAASAERLSCAGSQPAARSRVDGTTHGSAVNASSLAGAGVMPSRCRRSAVPYAMRAGSSMRRSPVTSSTSSWVRKPSLATVTAPSTAPTAASSSADTRSSTWQNCQCGRESLTTSSRGASK